LSLTRERRLLRCIIIAISVAVQQRMLPAKTRRMIMKKIATSALLAMSILGGIATVATAGQGEEFGTRTTAQQQPSPN
jgi:hypothetical protein